MDGKHELPSSPHTQTSQQKEDRVARLLAGDASSRVSLSSSACVCATAFPFTAMFTSCTFARFSRSVTNVVSRYKRRHEGRGRHVSPPNILMACFARESVVAAVHSDEQSADASLLLFLFMTHDNMNTRHCRRNNADETWQLVERG